MRKTKWFLVVACLMLIASPAFATGEYDLGSIMTQYQTAATQFGQNITSIALKLTYTLPDSTVIFGHGIWFGLLLWRLLGYSAGDASGMRSFRHFQLGFPMPNCAVFTLTQVEGAHWGVRASGSVARRISSVRLDIGAFQEDALAEIDAAAAQEPLLI